MKSKTLLLAALCAANFGACYAAPPEKTPIVAKQVGAAINATTRNNKKSDTALLLAENGKAKMPIVIAAKAGDATKAVAKDLALILGKITGATFTIEEGDGSKGIVLGSLKEFALPAFNQSLQINNGYDGREAYAIRTRPDKLLLIGATDLGVNHAAYRFLHEIGYRWFFPAKIWEVVPRTSKLSFGRDITDRPAILSRSIWFEAGSGTPEANELYQQWRRTNAQTESFVSNAGHNLFVIPDTFPEEFKAHPEYYAQTKDGKPIGGDIELTNPAVRKLVVEYARRFFKGNPNADMVSIDPTDTHSHSQSAEALKTSYSDQIFGTANEVAKMLQKEFPGKMVGLLSYNAQWDPPSFPLESNVHVQMSGLGQGKYTPAERERIWPTRSQNRGTYEYYSVFLWNYDKLTGSWTNNVKGVQASIKGQASSGVTAISAESTSNWGLNGRGYYIATRMMWNPEQNLEAVLDDFYSKAFGPAAPAMKKYYDTLDPANARFLSKHLIGTAFRALDEATRLAKDRPDVQARLDFLKQYLRYAHLEWAQSRDGVKDLGEEIARHAYRVRNDAILTWEMARQTWWGNKDWSGETYNTLYTHTEIEKNFQEGLKYFPTRNDIGAPLNYSPDLVAISWTAAQKGTYTLVTAKDDKGKDLGLTQAYQGGARYALYSLKGEPLKFTTWAGDAWGGINRLSITDSKGVEVFKKDKVPNNETTVHNIAVPAPGLYWLDYSDNGSYWSMQTPDGMIASIPLGQTQDYRNMWHIPAQMFFYVPKGIKTIEYYYTRTAFHPGGPHKVVDPSGKVQKDVDVNGDWVSLPVPAGMDGKVWSFQNPVLGLFNFNNLPNLYAPTPDGLLIPREVAVKDGLTIRK